MISLTANTNGFMLNADSSIQYNMLDTNELRETKVHPVNYMDMILKTLSDILDIGSEADKNKLLDFEALYQDGSSFQF